ncbi:MAG: addiction module protein [Campylobacterales bacterium]|nr:addiction module protein [Campylobacterales bacterium]
MTMTITVNDSIADKVMAFLNSFPKEAVKIEPSDPWYADEVKRRADEYRRGEMKTVSLDQAFWDEMDDYIDTVA